MRQQFLILMCLLLISSCNQNSRSNKPTIEIEPDWNKLSINGRVKSISEISYSVGSSFGDPVKSDYNLLEMNLGFPCNSRTISFNKEGQITSIESQYGDKLIQTPIYDSNSMLIGEYMSYKNKILYLRQYGDTDITTHISNLKRYQPKEKFDRYEDLYDDILTLSRNDIRVENLDNTRMNFIDTLVVIRQNGIIREHEIESVNFYNLDGIQFLDGTLSLWPNDHFTHTYYENGTIKFENYSHGGKTRFDYDKEGRLEKSTYYDKDGQWIKASSYHYDGSKIVQEDVINWPERNEEEIKYTYDKNGRLALYTNNERNNRISFQYNKQGYLTNIIDSSYSYQISRNENGLITNVLIEHRGGYFSDTTLEFEYYSYDCFSIKNIHETDLSIYTDIKTTFDSCGNWISKICYIGDNPQVYYERTIEYY